MEALSPVQEKEGNPVKYLSCIGLLFVILLIFPQQIGLDIILASTCAILFISRPLWGVFFIIAVHSIMSCTFEVFWIAGHPIEIISSQNIPYGDSAVSPLVYPLSLFPFQIASFILLPSLIFHCRPFSSQHIISHFQKIIYITISFFFIWGMIVSLQATYPDKALYGLSRFASVAIIICYIIRFVDRLDTIRKIMVVYCCTAIIMSFFAYYGTYKGFENISYIWSNYGFTILQRQSLINGSSSFNPEIQGMLPGFGIAAKHEFSTFVVAAIFFSIYLFITVKKRALSLFYLVAIFTLYLSLYYGPSKLSLVGIIIGALLVTILCPRIRKHVAIVVLILVMLNIFGLAASKYTRPLHAKKMTGSTQSFNVVNDESEFSLSVKGRLAIMRQAAQRIKQTNGIGMGPEMLNRDHIFTHVHGHNFFITLLAEYGVPALMCVLILGVLLARRVGPIITSQTCSQNTSSLAVIPMTASFFAIFFEYSFDCFVWAPQLWILGSLLWISANIAYKNKVGKDLQVES